MSIKVHGAKLKSFKIRHIVCRTVVVPFECESNRKLERLDQKCIEISCWMYLVLIDLEIVTLTKDMKVNQMKLPFQLSLVGLFYMTVSNFLHCDGL